VKLAVLVDEGPDATPAPEGVGLPSAFGLLPAELGALLRGTRTTPRSVFRQLHRVASWHNDGPALTPATHRALLAATSLVRPQIAHQALSTDGASRVVVRTHDGHEVECVRMPRPQVRVPRTTLCISSQVGCAMGCTFCATGTMGIRRNLTAGEIVGEVLLLMSACGPRTAHPLNIVFMGMGEPLHNFDHVAKAIAVLCHVDGVGMSPNRITVSTSGLVPGIERLAALPVRPLLALSVNATTDEVRSRIMPVNRRYNLETLRDTLQRYPLRRGEKILLEYVLLRGENDSREDAQRLADFARGFRHNINVIPLNEHRLTAHKAPSDDWVHNFVEQVHALGCLVTVRKNRARDVQGACGQLVDERVELA
jgi:23S rRNA (adenine2503-C2)-methyltransferase